MIKVDKQKVKWNDLYNGSANELKKTYGLNDRQLDAQIRSHMDGSNASDRRTMYDAIYRRK